ncbi:uncharacterized protein LOC122757260 [Drosophila mojavensis]|uniref:uncharacterized protein LOC122757260 n=1 Tax=Drosophila mojavensis TaxID=7230 RepID=UPI001CD09B4F|nr:uncharacterized protein LOC122757260 [Drosophila mojavensis]
MSMVFSSIDNLQLGGAKRLISSPSRIDLNREAFRYDCAIDYSLNRLVCIGPIDVVYQHYGALKFAGEKPGLCCLSASTQKYNAFFQMTSFGAKIIEEHGYNPTIDAILIVAENLEARDTWNDLERTVHMM